MLDAAAFNYGLCQQLLAAIPVSQQPGPAFPIPLLTMTHADLAAWRDLLIQFFTGKNCFAQMVPILATWKADQSAILPAPAPLSNLEKADTLLLALTND